MSLEVKVYDNGDHTCLVWKPVDDKPIADCRGFAIKRTINGKTDYLHGFAGFTDNAKATADNTTPANCLTFPIQRYLWWDYYVKPGDKVQYSIIPVVGADTAHLDLSSDLASEPTPELTITGQDSGHISAFFNKGIVAAQWVSRANASNPKGQKLADVVAQSGNPLRAALSGLLLPTVTGLLKEAKANGHKIYAALYELSDPDLIDGLIALGEDCNLILANGAFQKKPEHDENLTVRRKLRGKVNLHDRIVGGNHFAHNKFVVVCDGDQPLKVLTGSTNWTPTGLCTQANNSIIVEDPKVAKVYLDYWNRIEQAANGYPKTYIEANSEASTLEVDGDSITSWCVPTSAAQDLDFARKLIANAQEGVLFLFFNPGVFEPASAPEKWTLLQNILDLGNPDNAAINRNLYIRGVVNQEISGLTEPLQPKKGQAPAEVTDPSQPSPLALYTGGNSVPQLLGHDVMVPRNIKDQFHEFEKEQLGASMVNIHSKVIVIDPFGDHPVVMTGSHNLGFKASSANDDNLMIVEGNAALAAAYAINIIAIFQNYRWNSYVEAHRQDPKVWHGPVDNDQWQAGHLTGDSLHELEFWLGGQSPAGAAEARAKAPQSKPAQASTPTTAHRIASPKKHVIKSAHTPAKHPRRRQRSH